MKQFFLFFILVFVAWSSQSHKMPQQEVKIGLKSEDQVMQKVPQKLWTCSMHPQIKAHEKGKCPICFMDLIPLTLNKSLPDNVIELNDFQIKSAKILTYPVLFEHDQKNLNLYGRVKLIPSKVYRITAWVGGRIDHLFVNSVGEKVKAGDPLYKIYSPVLISAQQELIMALSLLKNSKAASSRFLSLETNVRAIRQKLLFLGLTKRDLQKIEKQKSPSPHIVVHAKRSGVVKEVAINEGEYVQEGKPLLLIADMSQLWVEASVYEDDLQTIQGQTRSMIILDSHPKDEILAKLERVDPFVNPQTRSSRAIFLIDNKEGKYHENSFARVQIESHSQKGILIPHSSALFTGQKAVVFVKKGNEFRSTLVRVLEKTQSYYRVLGDLKVGDLVVAEGTFKLDSEFQIQAKDSMMSAKDLSSPYGSRLDFRNQMEKAKDWLSLKKASTSFIDHLSKIRDLYLELQLALAEDSFDESKEIFQDLKEKLFSIPINSLELHEKKVLSLMQKHLKNSLDLAISSLLFKDLRQSFSLWSQWMITLSKHSWLTKDEDLKMVYCPMAFDKKGAFWIQEEEDIMNPYMGTKMQECGEIKKWSKE